MKGLIKQHYKLICERGLIDQNTTVEAFLSKISEEFSEVLQYYIDDCHVGLGPSDNLIQEVIDLAMVCFNLVEHLEIDIEDEIMKNIKTQQRHIYLIK